MPCIPPRRDECSKLLLLQQTQTASHLDGSISGETKGHKRGDQVFIGCKQGWSPFSPTLSFHLLQICNKVRTRYKIKQMFFSGFLHFPSTIPCPPGSCHTFTIVQSISPTYLSTRTVYQHKIQFFRYFGGYGHTGKWIQKNIIFMRLCCCFKQQKD